MDNLFAAISQRADLAPDCPAIVQGETTTYQKLRDHARAIGCRLQELTGNESQPIAIMAAVAIAMASAPMASAFAKSDETRNPPVMINVTSSAP